MDSPVERVEVLRWETEVFKERIAGLTAADWERPSACAGWSVADVVAHLVGQDFALRVARGLQGDFSPPEGAPPVAEHDEDRFAEAIFQRAFATREQAGQRLPEVLAQRLDAAVAVFDSIDPTQPELWDALCYWPPGPEPVRTMLDMRISELAMHAWDVCSRFDPDYRLSDGSVRVLTDTAPRAVRRAFRPDPELVAPVWFRFQVDIPISAAYDLTFSRAGTRLEPADAATGSGAADVTFRCDGETYVMVMYGRLTPAAAIESGRLTYTGDAALAGGFGARFIGG